MNNPNEFEYHDSINADTSHARHFVRFFWLLLVCLCGTFTLNVHAQSNSSDAGKTKAIKLGLVPHLSNQVMMKKYRPLVTYLQQELQRPVVVITAPNFTTYIKRAEKGDFDIYMTAPNMAAYHEKHNSHSRLVKFTQKLQGVIVVAEDSPYQSLDDLKGKTMTTPDIMAVVTSLGELTLKENGIDPEKDINLKYTPSHNNALQAVAEEKSDAAILGYPAYKIITSGAKLRKPTRILVETKTVPHMMFMSPPRVSTQEQEQLKTAMLKFPASDAGKKFFSGVPFKGIALITDEDMLLLEEVLQLLEQRLKN